MSLPSLTLMRDGAPIKTFPLEGEVILGRAPGCTIRVADRAISRQHAVFRSVGNSIQVEKKSEFAPLIVNGAECQQAILKEGDLVSAGPYVIRYEAGVAPVTEKPATPEPHSEPPAQSSLEGTGSSQPRGEGLSGNIPVHGENGDGALASQGIEGEAPPVDPFAAENPAQDSNLDPVGSEGAVEPPSSDGSENQPPAEAQNDGFNEPIDEDGKTKLTPVGKVSVKLVFQPGTANVEEYELSKDVTFIGRGKDCDIVLNDKKASRKNSMIRKSGVNYIIKDLESSNGTFINGIKIQEQELSGEDLVKVGNVEFVFKAMSMDYLAGEKDLVSIPVEEVQSEDPMAGAFDPAAAAAAVPGMESLAATPSDPASAGVAGGLDLGKAGEMGNIPGISGIPGMGGATSGKKKSLIDRFRALPKRTQMIGVVAAVLFFWWLSEDEDLSPLPMKKKPAATQKKAVTAPTGEKGPLTFDMLTPEQKRFVEAQHTLAFDSYKNKEYDKALYEVQKIFTLTNDYKDAREIERYAKEGKRKMEAIEEERKKKEDEAILKAKIAQLVEETRQRMEKKQYDQAKEYFIQILGLDPESPAVTAWRKEIEAYEEALKLQTQQKQVEQDINKHGWTLYAEGVALKKKKRYHEAIPVLQKSIDIGISDKTLAPAAKAMIAACHQAIARLREPVLKKAKSLEESGDFSNAYAMYKKATHIDPPHPGGYAGMNRIKKVLHERAKVAYTEAILAESYSDFAGAKKMFEECLSIAPAEDVYHERAMRKLSRYFKRKDDAGNP